MTLLPAPYRAQLRQAAHSRILSVAETFSRSRFGHFASTIPLIPKPLMRITAYSAPMMALLALTGCAGQNVTHSGFLPEKTYGDMTPKKGHVDDHIYVKPGLDASKYQTAVIDRSTYPMAIKVESTLTSPTMTVPQSAALVPKPAISKMWGA